MINGDGFTDLRQPVKLAAGDQHLAGRDLIENKVLPAGVQLREHIVEQQNRLLARITAKKLAL